MGHGNATVSTLTYSPKPEDHGRLLACQAHVEGLPGSIVEDSRRLWVQCKLLSSYNNTVLQNSHKKTREQFLVR